MKENENKRRKVVFNTICEDYSKYNGLTGIVIQKIPNQTMNISTNLLLLENGQIIEALDIELV